MCRGESQSAIGNPSGDDGNLIRTVGEIFPGVSDGRGAGYSFAGGFYLTSMAVRVRIMTSCASSCGVVPARSVFALGVLP